MKSFAIVLALMVVTFAIAGCGGKKSDKSTSTASPTGGNNTTKPANSTPPRTTPPATSPPTNNTTAPPHVYPEMTFKYGDGTPPGNGPRQTLTVDNGTTKLDLSVKLVARAACTPGPCELAENPADPAHSTANATLQIKPPAGANVTVAFMDITANTSATAGAIFENITRNVTTGVTGGAWDFQIYGVGLGIDVKVNVTGRP